MTAPYTANSLLDATKLALSAMPLDDDRRAVVQAAIDEAECLARWAAADQVEAYRRSRLLVSPETVRAWRSAGIDVRLTPVAGGGYHVQVRL